MTLHPVLRLLLLAAVLSAVAGCSRPVSLDARLVGTWEGKEKPKGADPRDKFDEVTITADFKKNGELVLSLAGEPMFKGRWSIDKADGNDLTVSATGRDFTRSGSITEVNGKKVEK